MAVLTGADGQLRYKNQVVAKARDFTINIVKDALETTCLASFDRSYVQGLRGSSGAATVLYDPNDFVANSLLNSILEDGDTSDEITFVLNRADGAQFRCSGFLTSISPSVGVGAVQAVAISFQINGKPEGEF